jgi:hypothetical protein
MTCDELVRALIGAGGLWASKKNCTICCVTSTRRLLLFSSPFLSQAYVGLDLKETEVGSIPKQAGFRCDRIIFLSVRKWDNRTTRNVSPLRITIIIIVIVIIILLYLLNQVMLTSFYLCSLWRCLS